MALNNPLAAVLSRILNAEQVGKRNFTTPLNSKMIRAVLQIMQDEGYITTYTEDKDARGNSLTINLAGKVNKTGVITPQFNVDTKGFVQFEKRYLPSKDFGVLILSTNKGIMTHKQAKEENVGGKLLAYVY
ncbi:MAG: 30S ribosomal protein S8 [Candidatus Woesearchaeota archaeon]|nr:30S ribosomal protein S8 [Candidatus Woesearchaeota archaeon]